MKIIKNIKEIKEIKIGDILIIAPDKNRWHYSLHYGKIIVEMKFFSGKLIQKK